jgi:hypothetical protein
MYRKTLPSILSCEQVKDMPLPYQYMNEIAIWRSFPLHDAVSDLREKTI